MLFGEYTVTLGSGALAVPYDGFWGYWEFGSDKADIQDGLQLLFEHIFHNQNLKPHYNLRKFRDELDSGLYFSSNIPQGYGLGSSGALVAAAYDRYGLQKTTDYIDLKNILGDTECAFHGSSSGVDPLVAYLHSPILIKSIGHILDVNQVINKKNIYLVNTGITRKTDLYIDIFKSKIKNNPKFTRAVNELSSLNQKAINAALCNDNNGLFTTFGQISSIQFEYFKEMIPECLSVLWHEGIKSNEYYFKLCGAGGGGMMLCMVKSPDELPQGINSFPHYTLE